MKFYLSRFILWYTISWIILSIIVWGLTAYIKLPSGLGAVLSVSLLSALNSYIRMLFKRREGDVCPPWRVKFIVWSSIYANFLPTIPVVSFIFYTRYGLNQINLYLAQHITQDEAQQALAIKATVLNSSIGQIASIDNMMNLIGVLLALFVASFLIFLLIQWGYNRKKYFQSVTKK